MNAHTPLQDDPARRRARHLRLCEELAALGMELARAAAREAVRALSTPVEHRLSRMATLPAGNTLDPGILFTHLSHAVRQAIILEACIADGAFDRRLQFTLPEHRDDHDLETCEPLEDELAGELAQPADVSRQIRFDKPHQGLAINRHRTRNGRHTKLN